MLLYNAAALFLTKYFSISVKQQLLISVAPLFSFMSVNIQGQELFHTTVILKPSWALQWIFGCTDQKRFQSYLTFNFRLAAWLKSQLHYFTWATLKRKMDNDKPYPRNHRITGDCGLQLVVFHSFANEQVEIWHLL